MSEERAEYIAQSTDDQTKAGTVEHRNPSEQLGFARMPHIIGLDTELSDGAYRTYAILKYFAQNKDSAFPGIATLATLRGVKDATVKRHIAELVDKGLVSRERRLGTSSMTYLEDLPQEYLDAASKILQKRYDSRIKNDTTDVSKMSRKREQEEREQDNVAPLAQNTDGNIDFQDPKPPAQRTAEQVKAGILGAIAAFEQSGGKRAGVSDPNADVKSYRVSAVPFIAAAIHHDVFTSGDWAAARKMFDAKIPFERVKEYCTWAFDTHKYNGDSKSHYVFMDIEDWRALKYPPLESAIKEVSGVVL